MEFLTQFIAPILSLWVIHTAIFSSAKFVNEMRETVITGVYCGTRIKPDHRRRILWDWILCILGTILVCLIFAVLVYIVGSELLKDTRLAWVPFAIAFYPVCCAFGFALCSAWDFTAMRAAERADTGKAADASADVAVS